MRDGIARVARIFEGLLQRKIELLRATIEIDERGLRRTTFFSDGSTNSAAMKWTEISRIVAFKEDLFAYDLLCIALTDPNGTIIVDEEMEGFDEMIRALPLRVPGVPAVEDWWLGVIQPAFATNFTVIFHREQP
jgi:hypothetical protein